MSVMAYQPISESYKSSYPLAWASLHLLGGVVPSHQALHLACSFEVDRTTGRM